jgi:AraC-like DNA-binding protein
MSATTFHMTVKEIAVDSLVPYREKIRPTKAGNFTVQENLKGHIAADKAGHESPSRTSREFKRSFGQSLADMTRKLRAASCISQRSVPTCLATG